MKFTDTEDHGSNRYSPRKLDYILAGAGHLIILVIGLITFSSSAQTPTGGDDAVMVTMITAASAEEISPAEITVPVEIPEEATSIQVPLEVPVEEEEVIEEPEIEEHPENPVEENPGSEEDFVSVTGGGSAGAGAPGPGTYESRVFNAVRREYRTSVEPERSYRIILTVDTDGTTTVEVIRKSGTSAFDRAVENALRIAQIPPMPPGRSSPAVINIEFIGPE